MTEKKTSELVSMVETAEKLLVDIEQQISAGNDSEAEKLSQQYEDELEKVFSHKSTSRDCLITKLDFSKRVIVIDHPIEELVERAFESLSDDVQILLAS